MVVIARGIRAFPGDDTPHDAVARQFVIGPHLHGCSNIHDCMDVILGPRHVLSNARQGSAVLSACPGAENAPGRLAAEVCSEEGSWHPRAGSDSRIDTRQ